jgi:hypothetical protein
VSSPVSGLQPWLRPYAEWCIGWTQHYWPTVKVTSVFRSTSDQLRLWNERASNPYPVARPGTSKHEQGLAWDMVGPADALAWAGRVWQSIGGTWGGAFKNQDPIHFEV